jgi:beta-mannosidase
VTGQYDLYNRGASLIHTEFGVEGITNLRTLDAAIAPEHQLPVALENPVWQHLGAWWVKTPMWRETFGDVADAATLVRATQFMQADGLRYALEADRRRKYHNSGSLPWQFNEPYPMAACTSAVDYYGQPKPVYYAVARAYAPLTVTAKFATIAWAGRDTFEAELWVNNSLEALSDTALTARIVGLGGEVAQEWTNPVDVPANRATFAYSVRMSLGEFASGICFLDLRLTASDARTLAHNRYVFTTAANLEPLLSAPATMLTVHCDERSREWALTITNTGTQAALFIWLEDAREIGAPGYAYFGDNHFCLFPGEFRHIPVAWHGVPPAGRSLNIRGWNTDPLAQP